MDSLHIETSFVSSLVFLYTVITDSDLPRDIYICSVHMLVFVCVLQVIVNYKNVSSCCFILLKMHQPHMDTSMRNKLVCPQDNVHMLTVGFTFEMRMIYLRNSISVFSLVSICMIKGLTWNVNKRSLPRHKSRQRDHRPCSLCKCMLNLDYQS